MPAHAVTGNRLDVGYWKIGFDQCWQLLGDVVVHMIVRKPRGLSCIKVEPCAFAQIIAFIVGNVVTTWAGVRSNDCHAKFCSLLESPCFLHEVFIATSQAG